MSSPYPVRVLLVYSLRNARAGLHPLDSYQDMHIGLSYVGGFLKAKGHEVRLVVLSSERRNQGLALLIQTAEAFRPELIGFTAVATQFPFANWLARELKKRWPDSLLILGGTHASLRPEEAIRGSFDAVCVGEGELPMSELADQLSQSRSPAGIPNLWIKRADGTLERNPAREFLENLDELPPPHRAMWRDWIVPAGSKRHVVLPSRGCPYQCAYCCNHALQKVAKGRYVRFRSPAAVVAEIQSLMADYPDLEEIYLQSETIVVNASWLRELSEGIANFNAGRPNPVAFACNFRVARQFLTDEIFESLARANVRTLEVGLESGSERLRREVLRRHYTNEELLQTVAMARQRGMAINLYNMIGLPGETLADHRETVELNRRVDPNRSFTSIFFPYPGTDLHETCRQQGLLHSDELPSSERYLATLDLPGFRKRQIQRACEWFDFNIYKGHRPLHYRLRSVLRNKLAARPGLNRLFMALLPIWHSLKRH